ncbi:MAG: sugar transferase [Acidimicrobiia bacterium]|nr:sugar transferase [Acidimicrobiia bacterium]
MTNTLAPPSTGPGRGPGRLAGAVFRLGQLAAVAGVAWFHASLVAPEPYSLFRSSRLVWWVVVAATLAAASYGLGLPELPARRPAVVARAMAAYGLAAGAVSVAQLALAQPLLPRSSLALLGAIVPLWSVLAWNLAGDVAAWRSQRDRVFVVSAQPGEPAALAFELTRRAELPAVLAGSLSVGDARLGPDGWAPLLVEAGAVAATVVVLDTAAQSDDGIVAQAAELHRRGVRVRTLALFYEQWLGKLPVAELARVSLLFDIGEVHRLGYMRAKRVVDLALGLVGLPVLAAALPLVWLGDQLANPGPVLFRQRRVGREGEPFTIWKFRTMVPGPAPDAASPWTAEDDPRVTPFGRLLRRSHLDELPQLVNVLRGELSIVGPRPEQPHYVEELRGKIAFYDVRHLVRPGLTGWAQVKQGYAADEHDALEKLQYDVFYLRRQGLGLDLRILWRTLRGVVGGDGR